MKRTPAAAAPQIPPPLELECLKVLWDLGHGSVRDVREVLNRVPGSHKLAYTTVMTVLDRLEKRGGVTRKRHGRAFIYEPRFTRDDLRRVAIRELANSYFGGSEDAMFEYLRASRQQDAAAAAHADGDNEPLL